MNALIGLEDKSQLALSSSGIGLPQPGQQPRDPGPALLQGHPLRGNLFDAVLHRLRIPSQRDHRFQTNVADSEGFLARKDLKPLVIRHDSSGFGSVFTVYDRTIDGFSSQYPPVLQGGLGLLISQESA